jgi:hypothetical protein
MTIMHRRGCFAFAGLRVAGNFEAGKGNHECRMRASSPHEGISLLQRDFSGTSSSPKNGPAHRNEGRPYEDRLEQEIVSAAGFEPATHALKGHCSTN